MLTVIKTTHSVLPWRLKSPAGLWIPHAHCRTKREALALKARLEAAADWGVAPDTWPAEVLAAAEQILAGTASAQIERAAHARGGMKGAAGASRRQTVQRGERRDVREERRENRIL